MAWVGNNSDKKNGPDQGPGGSDWLPTLELDIRTTAFLANSGLGPECNDSLWDQEIAAYVVDVRRVGYDRCTTCLQLRTRY